VNDLVSCNIPLLAPPQAGVAERSRKCREASADREDGVVFSDESKTAAAVGKPPGLSLVWWLRESFLMTQLSPP
jgi:hypothetical protein